MSEIENIIRVLRERELCSICVDSADDNCMKCDKVKGATMKEITTAFNAAIQALQEKLEREKGCEYCKGGGNAKNLIDEEITVFITSDYMTTERSGDCKVFGKHFVVKGNKFNQLIINELFRIKGR